MAPGILFPLLPLYFLPWCSFPTLFLQQYIAFPSPSLDLPIFPNLFPFPSPSQLSFSINSFLYSTHISLPISSFPFHDYFLPFPSFLSMITSSRFLLSSLISSHFPYSSSSSCHVHKSLPFLSLACSYRFIK